MQTRQVFYKHKKTAVYYSHDYNGHNKFNLWRTGVKFCQWSANEKESTKCNCLILGGIGKYYLGYFKSKKDNCIYYLNRKDWKS